MRRSTPGARGTPSSFRSFWRSRRGLSPSATPLGNRCDSAFLRNASNRPIQARSAFPFYADSSRFQQDIVQNFCHYIHFFRSRKDAEVWTAKTPGTFILSLDEATELARRKNQLQFGALLSGNADRDRHERKKPTEIR